MRNIIQAKCRGKSREKRESEERELEAVLASRNIECVGTLGV